MKVAGIVAEYNPFHNGHLYHLRETKKKLDPDVTIAVMSGDFLQRGEPALLSKWPRTKMALKSGVDLVFELPYAYAVQKADTFAAGAVAILDQLGADFLCFGSESGDMSSFQHTLSLMELHDESMRHAVKSRMAEGYSYPKAFALAFQSAAAGSDRPLVDFFQPNNNLGFHYLRAIKARRSKMRAATVARTGTDYHDDKLFTGQPIASSTGIRKHLLEGKPVGELRNKLPADVFECLQIAAKNGRLTGWEVFFPFLKYRLLSTAADDLTSFYGMEEGIEHRLVKKIKQAEHFSDFIAALKTKRYTWTRLQRLAAHVLTGAKKNVMKSALGQENVPYLRLLGMNQAGRDYLHSIKKQLSVPLISKIKKERHPLLDLDIKTAQLYEFIAGLSSAGKGGGFQETEKTPVRFEERTGRFLNEA